MVESGHTESDAVESPSFGATASLYMASLVCPGIVWAYKRHYLRSVLVTVGLLSLWIAYAFFWLSLKFNPIWPTFWFIIVWGILLILNAHDAAVAPVRRFALRPGIVLGVCTMLGWFVPLIALASLFFRFGGSFVQVNSASMFPTVLPGDLVWVDRQIYNLHWPRPSDVVVYRSLDSQEIRMGRVVGFPGDVIEYRDGELHFSRYQMMHGLIEEEYALRFQQLTGMLPSYADAQFESLGGDGIVYPVAGLLPSDENKRFDGEEWVVGEGQLFVLNDNRGHIDDSRVFGPIRYDQLVGMPLYILNNNSFQGAASENRIGMLIQKPRIVDE